jgi:MFS family permease
MGMMGFVAMAGPLAAGLGLNAGQIGLSAMAGGLGWVLASRPWGSAADRLGRRTVLLTGLAGYGLFYLALCCVALAGLQGWLGAGLVLIGLIVARFAIGLSYAAVPAAATAVIADHYAPDARPAAMGRLGAAQASGMLLGPAFVALTAGPSPVWPLFVLAGLALPVFVLMAWQLPADKPASEDVPASALPLHDLRLRAPAVAALATMVAVGIAQIVVGFLALDRLDLPGPAATRLAGGALAAVAVALIVAQILVGRLRWSTGRLMLVGAVVTALGFVAAALAPNPITLVAGYALAGLGAGWVLPSISAMAANAVRADEQGRAAGTVSTALGMGSMIGPALGGLAYGAGDVWPLLISASMLLVPAAVGLGSGRSTPERTVKG